MWFTHIVIYLLGMCHYLGLFYKINILGANLRIRALVVQIGRQAENAAAIPELPISHTKN